MIAARGRLPAVALLAMLLGGCGGRISYDKPDVVPFDRRLNELAALQNNGRSEELRTHFAKGASIQSPVTLRETGIESYLVALRSEPYTLAIKGTEIVYSQPGRAVTRSAVTASAPGRFQLADTVTVDWRFEDGYWRISRLRFADWPTVVGTWRRGGLRGEKSIELRILPGGSYVIHLDDDYTVPAFRGRYRLEGNRLELADVSAAEPGTLQTGDGSYMFMRTSTGANFRLISDDNTWRSERFDGAWVAR